MATINQLVKAVETRMVGDKKVPNFRSGDTVSVSVRVVEGERQRLQNFEGVVIARRNNHFNSSFTVRKISGGVGVERTFHLYSNEIEDITVKRYGRVRRAKLYYIRELSGRKARIREKISTKRT